MNSAIHLKTSFSAPKIVGVFEGIYKPYLEFYYDNQEYSFPFKLGIKIKIFGDAIGYNFSFEFTVSSYFLLENKISETDIYELHINMLRTAQQFVNNNPKLVGCEMPIPKQIDIIKQIKGIDGLYEFMIE